MAPSHGLEVAAGAGVGVLVGGRTGVGTGVGIEVAVAFAAGVFDAGAVVGRGSVSESSPEPKHAVPATRQRRAAIKSRDFIAL